MPAMLHAAKLAVKLQLARHGRPQIAAIAAGKPATAESNEPRELGQSASILRFPKKVPFVSKVLILPVVTRR
jgi:hypothetical protein